MYGTVPGSESHVHKLSAKELCKNLQELCQIAKALNTSTALISALISVLISRASLCWLVEPVELAVQLFRCSTHLGIRKTRSIAKGGQATGLSLCLRILDMLDHNGSRTPMIAHAWPCRELPNLLQIFSTATRSAKYGKAKGCHQQLSTC